jgi:AraC-like DNA-binding protein
VSTDTLSEVLQAVRLKGAVYFAVDAFAPWVAEAPEAQRLAPHLMPGVEHVIEFHVVIRGSCWGGLIDEPAIRLDAGDVLVFPQGDAHVMSSAPGMRGEPELHLEHALGPSELPIAITKNGGGTDRSEVICGFLGCDARPFNPLLATLPRVLHVKKTGAGEDVLAQFVQLALSESTTRRSGGESVLARLSELLFIEVVRRYVATLPPETTGWLAGLRDDNVGRALGKLHHRPAHPWTLNELARDVGASRSALAERFAELVGIPPMQYLTQWRMQLAATHLAGTNESLSEIAGRVGYGSEAALSHAFKRWVGVAPALWRQKKRAPHPPGV